MKASKLCDIITALLEKAKEERYRKLGWKTAFGAEADKSLVEYLMPDEREKLSRAMRQLKYYENAKRI